MNLNLLSTIYSDSQHIQKFDANQFDFLKFLLSFVGAPVVLIILFVLFAECVELYRIKIKNKNSEPNAIKLTHKGAWGILQSVCLAAVGFTAIGAGATVIVLGLKNFTTLFVAIFQIKGALPFSDVTALGVMKQFNSVAIIASVIMVLSIFLNLILAKLTKFKFIFLTIHHVLFLSVVLTVLFESINIHPVLMCVMGTLLIGLYITLSPRMTSKYMELSMGEEEKNIALGHFHSFAFALTAWIGSAVGKINPNVKKYDYIWENKNLAEEVTQIEKSKKVKFKHLLQNQNVVLLVVMTTMMMALYCSVWIMHGWEFFFIPDALKSLENKRDALNPQLYINAIEFFKTQTSGLESLNNFTPLAELAVIPPILSNGESPISKALLDSILFTTGVLVLSTGIYTMNKELVPAVEKMGKNFIPNVKVALDAPVIIGKCPNAVTTGFLFSLAGGMFGAFISYLLVGISGYVIIPGIVSLFFTGSASATLANSKGGRVGAWIGSFVQGLIQTIIPVLFIIAINNYASLSNLVENKDSISSIYTDSDFGILLLFGIVARLNSLVFVIFVITICSSTIAYLIFMEWFRTKKKQFIEKENLETFIEENLPETSIEEKQVLTNL